MIELPIDSRLGEIAGKVRAGGAVVVVAAPGAGKSTRVPVALLDAVEGAVVMLQPRRVAARAVAGRIAQERGWRLGEEVGYHVRFEKRYGRATRIRVMTEGILTRMLVDDPYLEGVGCVILDEFHERGLHTDLAAAFLREIQQTVRPELKVVVMSATLDAGAVAAFLGGAQVVEVEGRSWPVEIAYRPARDVKLEEQVVRVVVEALDTQDTKHETQNGDVLVFLPGVGEIERVRRAMGERAGIVVIPLHGSLTLEEQQRALVPDSAGRRKVILATNIAETSLTIDGVRAVVDSGMVRVASFDSDRGMDRLDLERVSQASATQRTGRAGRQGPGRAFRLWAESEQKHLAAFNVPEVERVDLSQAVLAVHAWGAKDVRAFGWFEKPGEERLVAAEGLLEMLGALHEGKLTVVGKALVGMPVHPRIGRMLLAASGTKWMEEAMNLAAILSDDSRRGGSGDVLAMVERVPGHLMRVREQLGGVARSLRASPGIAIPGLDSLGEILLVAYGDRVARRRAGTQPRAAVPQGDPRAAVMVGGTGLRVAEEAFTPALAASELFVALEVHHDPRNRKAEATVGSWAVIEEEWLRRLFPEQMRTETALEFDAAKGKVMAINRRYFADLVLREDPHGKVEGERAGTVLAAALAERTGELFLNDEGAARFLARVALVRHFVSEKAWPRFDDGELREALAEACAGKRSVTEVLDGHGLEQALRGRLAYPLDRELEALAPETIEVPSGSRIRLAYAMPGQTGDARAGFVPPVLAVRLQEVFGWTQTPRVCAGRLPVVMHLLSPGYKPMQITTDLASFWRSAYFEVRKDLRVRYPKHKWPDDPLAAKAEAKGPRRG